MAELCVPTDMSGDNSRSLTCAQCGTAFECGLSGGCWCADEPYRLRMTDIAAQQDCLCRDCLRKAAAAQGQIVTEN